MNKKLSLVLFIVTISICGVLFIQNRKLAQKIDQLATSQNVDSVKVTGENEEEEFELAPLMGRMQVYANKLWFAGESSNWDLALFYVEEIEECMEDIQASDLVENGVQLNTAVKEWGLGPLAKLEESIEQKDANLFKDEYNNLTINCSGCHTVTQHAFIKIIIPTAPVFTNQKYSIQ